MKKYYLNLTNGIEALNHYKLDNYSFIRIQSTYCEQKLWDNLLQDLDYNFLMDLALGNKVIIYDYSPYKNIPRAMYQGVPFIEYVLYRRWLDIHIESYVKKLNCTSYFDEIYNNLNNKTKKKLDYFKKFINCNRLNIEVIAQNSDCEKRMPELIQNFKKVLTK